MPIKWASKDACMHDALSKQKEKKDGASMVMSAAEKS
jgi:hypothetical protein